MYFSNNLIFTIFQLFSTVYPLNKPTNFEVKAILVNCQNPECNNDLNKLQTISKSSSTRKKSDTCHQKPNNNNGGESLTNCLRKLLLTIKIINSEGIDCSSGNKYQYIVIDHIIDEISDNKIMLLEPIVVKFNQKAIIETYDLVFENMVNSEATEKIFDKQGYKNYKGCDKSLCGTVKYDGEVVPFSSGFCCSCSSNNLLKNYEQSSSFNKQNIMLLPSNSIGYDDSNSYNNNNNNKMEFIPMVGLIDGFDRRNKENRHKREVFETILSSKGQNDQEIIRNGRCTNNFNQFIDNNPSEIDDESTTHCLQFSNEWYSVYNLKNPKFEHEITIKIYQKTENPSGLTKWKDLTTNLIKIGTNNQHTNSLKNETNISIKYKLITCGDFSLNPETQTLLIPDETNKKNNKIEDSLVLPKKFISTDGKQCDVAGVGFEAFHNQEQRCQRVRGSCLKNQPKKLLTEDQERERNGIKGKYLLKSFALPVSGQNIDNKNIRLYHNKMSRIRLDIELNADFLALLQPHSSAIITEVYTESTNPQKIRFIAKITNSGLISGIFSVSLNGCSLDLPASFNDISSKPVLIHPQHQHIFILNIDCLLPDYVSEFNCLLNVFNINRELVALKPIRFVKFDRCLCVWYCSCVCVQTDNDLKCKMLNLDEYHAAGFQGGLPMSSSLIELNDFDLMLSTLFHLFIFLTFTLLIMGLIKALIGLFCCNVIGFWGIDLILGLDLGDNVKSKTYNNNNNNTYTSCCPIKSKSKQHRVRYISRQVQFWLNVVFFFIYPIAFLNVVVRKLFFVSYTNEKDDFVGIEEDECRCDNNQKFQNNNSNSKRFRRRPSIGKSYVILRTENNN